MDGGEVKENEDVCVLEGEMPASSSSSSSFTFEMFELDCDWEYERDE